MVVEFKNGNSGIAVIQDGEDMGRLCDVLVNHAAQIVDEQTKEDGNPTGCLCYLAAAEVEKHVTDCERRAEEAEEKAAEAAQYIPATDDEIEREAQSRANQIRRQRAIEARANELTAKG